MLVFGIIMVVLGLFLSLSGLAKEAKYNTNRAWTMGLVFLVIGFLAMVFDMYGGGMVGAW